jgi:hypothetical protein
MKSNSARPWFLSFSLILLLVCSPTWGEIYTWVDENGKKHFGDKIPREYEDKATQYEISETNRSAAVEITEKAPTTSPYVSTTLEPSGQGLRKSQAPASCAELKEQYKKSRQCYEACKLPTGNIARCGHCPQMKKPNC